MNTIPKLMFPELKIVFLNWEQYSRARNNTPELGIMFRSAPLKNLKMRTFVGVKHNVIEKVTGGFGDKFVALVDVCKIIVVEFMRIPDESEPTTHKGLVCVKAHNGVVASNIVGVRKKVHFSFIHSVKNLYFHEN